MGDLRSSQALAGTILAYPSAMDRPEPVRDLDWDAATARELGDGAVALWSDFLTALPDLPIDRALTVAGVRTAVLRDVPAEPTPIADLLAYARTVLLDASVYCGHPGFMAYVSGPGTVPGAAADLLAATVNQNVGGWRLSPAATEIELHLTHWFAERFGLPAETAGGLITSGGSMANFVGLKVARDHRAPGGVAAIRSGGLSGTRALRVYASTEIHAVSDRAVDMLGIGTDNLVKIPVDGDFRIRLDLLEQAIADDRAAGYEPIVVEGSAGTVSTGAIDPLPELADLAERHGLWFHVDGAYGGPAVFADDLRPQLDGIQRADSIAFDPHKWLYTPHSGGCVLFRDLQNASDSFDAEASYIHEDKELMEHGLDIGRMGPQFSRGFWAFKIWMSLLAHGTDAYARRISHDAELARYLGALVEDHPRFELACPVSLSICCFRYVPEGVSDEAYLNTLNERIMHEIQRDGRAYCSNAVLDGSFVLRACIVNFRSEAADVERLLSVADELGARFHEKLRSSADDGATL